MKKYIVIIIVLFLATNCFSQKDIGLTCDVRKASLKQIINGHQLFYSLPKNIVRVEIIVKKTTQIAGPLSNYAEKFLNLKDGVIKFDNEYFTISEAGFLQYSVPDSNHTYVITVNGFANFPMLQLNNDGVILGCNVNETIDGYETNTCEIINLEHEEQEFYFNNYGIRTFLEEKTETLYKMVQTDSTPVKIPYNKTSYVAKPDEKVAEDISDFIKKIRKRKIKLLLGLKEEVNEVDGLALQASIDELNRIEEYYISLFTGKTLINEQVFYFDFEPKENIEAEQQILAWFSPSIGVSHKKPEIRKSDFKPLIIKSEIISKLNTPGIELIDNSEKTPVPIKHGLYYRIPGKINLILQYTDKELIKKQVQIAQKGIVLPLPVDYLNNGYSIEFYGETGAIKRVFKK